MPTWNGGAPGATGRWDNNTWSTTFSFGGISTRSAGARWESVPILPGSTIVSATLAFTLSGEANSNRAVGIHQVDSAPPLGNGQRGTDNAPTNSWSAGGGAKTVDVTAAMQALVGRPGWAAGNALTIRWDGQTADFSDRTITSVSLTVDYFNTQDIVVEYGAQLWALSSPIVAPGAVTRSPTGVAFWSLSAPVVQAAAVIAVGAAGLWVPKAPTVSPSSPAGITAPSVTLWAPKAPSVVAQGTVGFAPTGVLLWQLTAPDLVRGYPVPPTPLDFQSLINSRAFLDAVNGRTPRATMSVDVLSPDRGAVLARLGSPHTSGPLAADRGGFESIKVWCKGDSGRPTWVHELVTRDPTLMPGGIDPKASMLLDPTQHNFLRVWWWILVDGIWQRIPLGTGTVNAIAVSDGPEGFAMTVMVRDLLADIARAHWNESVPLGGLAVSDGIRAVLASRAPWAPVQLAPTTARLPEDWAHGMPNADPTVDLARMAEAAGGAARTNRMGDFIVDPIQDRSSAPVRARFAEGPRDPGDGVTPFEEISTSLVNMDEVVNSVKLSSASPSVDPPVSGKYEITDENSPLWIGKRLYSRDLSDPIITSSEQAVTMARNYVLQRGVLRRLVLRHPPRVDLTSGDIAEVVRARAALVGRWTVCKWDIDRAIGMQTTVLESEVRLA